MQKSDELADVAGLMFQQVKELGINAWTTGFNVWSDDNNTYTDYVTSPLGGFIEPYTIDTTVFPSFKEISDAKKSGEEFYVQYLEGELLKETYLELSKFGDKEQYVKIREGGFEFPIRQFDHFVFLSNISLMFITYDPVPEAMIFSNDLGKSSNRLIPVSSICKKRKHSQENLKYNLLWNAFAQVPWPCTGARNCKRLYP